MCTIQSLADTDCDDYKWKDFDQQNDRGQNCVRALHPGAGTPPEEREAPVKNAGSKRENRQYPRPEDQRPVVVKPEQVEQ